MKAKENLIRVYTGTDVTVNLLKDELEKVGISGIIRNDFNSGVMAGFSGGSLSSIDLFILDLDMDKAQPIINEFLKINEER